MSNQRKSPVILKKTWNQGDVGSTQPLSLCATCDTCAGYADLQPRYILLSHRHTFPSGQIHIWQTTLCSRGTVMDNPCCFRFITKVCISMTTSYCIAVKISAGSELMGYYYMTDNAESFSLPGADLSGKQSDCWLCQYPHLLLITHPLLTPPSPRIAASAVTNTTHPALRQASFK